MAQTLSADPDAPSEAQADGVGHGQPPAATRFRKGQSGNPKGRPRGSKSTVPYEAVLGQQVTIREDGKERKVTAAEAFLLHVSKKGLAGDGAAGRAALAAIEEARAARCGKDGLAGQHMVFVWMEWMNANMALRPLRMATKIDPLRDTARMLIEPWLVQVALARFGERRLTIEEQTEVRDATRTPGKVKWPDWWVVK